VYHCLVSPPLPRSVSPKQCSYCRLCVDRQSSVVIADCVQMAKFPRERTPKKRLVESNHVRKLLMQLNTLYRIVGDDETPIQKRQASEGKVIVLFEQIDKQRWRDTAAGVPQELRDKMKEGTTLSIRGLRSHSVELYGDRVQDRRSCCGSEDSGCQVM
jgi:hypothetical protein